MIHDPQANFHLSINTMHLHTSTVAPLTTGSWAYPGTIPVERYLSFSVSHYLQEDRKGKHHTISTFIRAWKSLELGGLLESQPRWFTIEHKRKPLRTTRFLALWTSVSRVKSGDSECLPKSEELEDSGHFETASEERESPKNRTSKKPASKSIFYGIQEIEKNSTAEGSWKEEEEESRVSEDEFGPIIKQPTSLLSMLLTRSPYSLFNCGVLRHSGKETRLRRGANPLLHLTWSSSKVRGASRKCRTWHRCMKVLSSNNNDVNSAKHELPHPLSRIDNQSQLSYIPIKYIC
ncbi:hypothetical protein DFP72DRAFT_1137994 [Ephemerocybe angulata]|uniref:Uncharacterized protein n=1 Tax=Ephemerocybe angulata TaxID=980116 RepID=A0A8H6HT43_9AGAR|nr:hypothetical protein DFP72DRAFT_1137994 [Tulosesus angulatus]